MAPLTRYVLLPVALIALLVTGCSQVRASRAEFAAAPELQAKQVLPAAPPREPDLLAGDSAHLDPALRAAVQDAARAAADAGVPFEITSGWRSRRHQQRLLDEAVDRYGSLSEALRYVSTPDASAHVTGDAVDIGPLQADHWLERYGAAWGLCRMFANEAWHFELATEPGGTCPDMLPDSSYRNRR